MPRFWVFGRSDELSGDVKSAEETDISEYEQKLNVNVIETSVKKEIKQLSGSGDQSCALNDSVLYYGVSLPSGSSCSDEEDKPLVFVDKKEALQTVKKHKGARFKAFAKKEDAVLFASQLADQICSTPKSSTKIFSPPIVDIEKSFGIVSEKSSPFRGPKCQDLVKLRKAIEAADIEYFKEMVWSNPRYLISSGDTPAILQEGFRYNALHVAAKHKQPKLCQLILDTIEDPKFMELLYSDDSEVVRKQRIAFITDLYLNMPDKGLCETPLHFASKFGCLQIVQILVSHPLCDRKRQNKYGLEPKEIICERCPSSCAELKQQIEEAFEDRFYVPVLRSKDNSVQPVVGEPYSPEDFKIPHCSPKSSSPCDPSLAIMAIAGPMSPTQAKAFYKQWKSPSASTFRNELRYLSKIRLSDPEKGLERLGRNLAKHMNTSWIEYWPSLNAWCDLSAPGGLELLENHLKKLYYQLTSLVPKIEGNEIKKDENAENYVSNPVSDLTPDRHPIFHSTPSNNTGISNQTENSSNSSGEISELCKGLQKFHLYDAESVLATSPDMPSMFISRSNNDNSLDLNSSDFEYELIGNCKNNLENKFNDCDTDNCEVQQDMQIFNSNELSDHYEINVKNSTQEHHIVTKMDIKRRISTDDLFLNILHQKPVLSFNKLSEESNSVINSTSLSVENVNCHPNKFQAVENNTNVSVAINSVIKSIFDAFSNLASNSDAIMQETTFHSLFADEVVPKIKCLPKLNIDNKEQFEIIHGHIAYKLSKEMQKHFLQHELDLLLRYLTSYLELYFSASSSDEENTISHNYSFNVKKNHATSSKQIKWQHLKCILQMLSNILSSKNSESLTHNEKCNCIWESEDKENIRLLSKNCKNNYVNNHFKQIDSNFKENNISCNYNYNKSEECSEPAELRTTKVPSSTYSADMLEEIYLTPPSSPSVRSSSSSNSFEDPVTPDEGLEVYIEGENPSKADVDILRAIENVNINPVLYPHVCRWKHLVSSKDRKIVESWPSPAVKRYRQHIAESSKNQYQNVTSPLATDNKKNKEHGIDVTPKTRSILRNQDSGIKEATNLYTKFLKCNESTEL